MKLVTFLHDNKEAVGVLTEDGAAVRPLPFADMNALIQASREALLAAVKGAAATLPLSAVTLLAPIPRPRQDVICLGINYKAHTEEAARYSSEAFTKERPIPINFSKRVTEAVAPEGDIESHPGLVERLDYEAELAVIIGKTAKNVMAEDAADYIFGYTVLNDVSARVLQTAHKQWYFGKSLDGFTPIGPCIVTADEFDTYPPALPIRSRVNGELRQDSNTSNMIFSCAEIVSYLSQYMTLKPGDMIYSGTPDGVILGMPDDRKKWLTHGDTIEVTIEGIGTLKNTIA